MVNSGYGFIVDSCSKSSEKEAWESFDSELKRITSFIKGYHYWRSTPQHYSNIDFSTGTETHIVKSRCVALKEKIVDFSAYIWTPIVIGEYQDKAFNPAEDFEAVIGHGLS